MNRTVLATLTLLSAVLLAAPGVGRAQDDAGPAKFTNLQILPKDISKKDLMAAMKAQSKALGVKCAFCHDVKNKDYATDDNEHKRAARGMMKLVQKLNAEIFTWPEAPKATCFMCHHGQKEPKMEP
jgi:hypothetical protein